VNVVVAVAVAVAVVAVVDRLEGRNAVVKLLIDNRHERIQIIVFAF
jgi:hypothetical protein